MLPGLHQTAHEWAGCLALVGHEAERAMLSGLLRASLVENEGEVRQFATDLVVIAKGLLVLDQSSVHTSSWKIPSLQAHENMVLDG